MGEEHSEEETTDDEQYGPKTGFNPSGPDPLEQLEEHTSEHPFIADMGIRLKSFEDGTLEASVPHDDRWANPGMEGALHGGIVMAYLDTVMGFTLMAAVANRSLTGGPTIAFNTNFLTPATKDMTATGEVIRVGSSSAVVDGRLKDEESGEAIATAQGVWRVYPDQK
jgi:uncharacterized protein (TIGR00369 family)